MATKDKPTVIGHFSGYGNNYRVMSDKTVQYQNGLGHWEWEREATSGEFKFAADLAEAVKALEDLAQMFQDEPLACWCQPALRAAMDVIEKAKAHD